MNRLEIGRRGHAPGWTTLDLVGPADIVAAAVPLPQEVWTQRWGVVQMIHALEHFSLRDASELLHSLHFITDRLIIEVPNLAYAAKRLLEDEAAGRPIDGRMAMWPLYGDQRHGAAYAHLWGYTPKSLKRLLEETGWTDILQEVPKYHVPIRDLRVTARGKFRSENCTIETRDVTSV